MLKSTGQRIATQDSSPSSTLIVADDLTGACDAAVAFAQRGHRTRVFLGGTAALTEGLDVCAISTATRDVPPEESERHLSAIASDPAFAGFPRCFKKIDSVFRGNTAHEIGAAIRLFGRSLAFIAPAYPALGRTSEGGILHVRDLHGERRIPALDMLHASGLRPLHIAAGTAPDAIAKHLSHLPPAHGGVLYFDATEQAHLEAAVLAADTLRKEVLWVGSGGLAHALAARHAHRPIALPSVPTGTVLVFAGSDHPVAARQIEHLLRRQDVLHGPAASSNTTPLDKPAAMLFRVACGRTSEQEILAATRDIDPGAVACLFMTGGDTAALVARALGITAIDLQIEFAPGLARGRAVGGRFAGRTLILKSGGFGEEAAISRLVEHFAQPVEHFAQPVKHFAQPVKHFAQPKPAAYKRET